jgi:hypothetical protein
MYKFDNRNSSYAQKRVIRQDHGFQILDRIIELHSHQRTKYQPNRSYINQSEKVRNFEMAQKCKKLKKIWIFGQ